MPSIRQYFHQHPVGKGATVALIGVADDELFGARRGEHGLPLDAGRESCPAPAAQAAVLDHRHDLVRRERTRRVEPRPTAMRRIIVEIERIDYAAAGEGDALLRGEEGQRRDLAEPVRMAAVEHRRHILGRDRAEADPALGSFDLDERLDPEQAMAAGAHDLDARGDERIGNLVGAERDRGHVAADEHPGHAATFATSRSSFAPSIRDTGTPSTIALGPVAHRPRQ